MNKSKRLRAKRKTRQTIAKKSNRFPYVFCLNLQRRPDRWKRFQEHLPTDWPFATPVRFPAIDGGFCQPPDWWKQGLGAWGCYRSHLRIVEESLNAGFESVLVFEDDAFFRDGFSRDALQFLSNVPGDWDMVYLGGQLLKYHLCPPYPVQQNVYRAHNVNRCHAYAINGKAMLPIYQHLTKKNWFDEYHVDHHLGLLHETKQLNIYVPGNWIVGQGGDDSDITYTQTSDSFWVNPEEASRVEKASLVLVISEYASDTGFINSELQSLGVWFGNSLDPDKQGKFRAADVFDRLSAKYPILHDSDLIYSADIATRVADAMGHLVWRAAGQNAVAGIDNPIALHFLPLLSQIFGERLRVVRYKPRAGHFGEAARSSDASSCDDTNSVLARCHIEREHALQFIEHFVVDEKEFAANSSELRIRLRQFLAFDTSPAVGKPYV